MRPVHHIDLRSRSSPTTAKRVRLETDETWTLEVVDHKGTSHVWEEQFTSDAEARIAAINAIETEGAMTFMRSNNVIPFRQR